ncbi:DUF4270 domain-containing protein [Gramella jeungdoensis]|uniref:DUF4270 domain-containing protein n=1 Tax=Gramella jeungdoensis TaxID=708091 RepID=A0ABT0Z5G1_9FLAO|nr:DUF4270 domain-containing protein [Gramella jeungdoensis]MCM8570956.1 DUF4270 domain-containing protein [Gramella jeungdoensis]
MKLKRLFQITTFLVVVFAFVGCDEDYTDIGGEIINNPTDVELREVDINAYSRKINSIQTNNLTNYFLGVNKNPVYGESTASIVTQLILGNSDPDFGENVELDSVVLKLPYYASEDETSSDEDNIEYVLDSVYGEGSFKLSVYETSYFLNDLDPNAGFEERQKYYSDQQSEVEENIVGEPLYINENFKPSADSFVTYEVNASGENDTITNTPALYVKLPVDYFKQKIIDKEGSDELLNNNNFKNYLRSLFIKAEPNSTEGAQIMFNLSDENAQITLYYTRDVEEDDETVRKRASYDLNFTGGNKFSTYTGEFPESILTAIEEQSSVGSENLYLKSQEGSMAVIDLFPDESVLEELKQNNWLINEANLTFYVNQEKMNGAAEPERLFLYDLENNTILVDYQADPTLSENDPLSSRTVFSSRLERDEDENGIFYKIRITQHLGRILSEDTENVKLGLIITGNINNSNLSAVRDVEDVERVPGSSMLTPYGTVLYGDEASNDEKRLKLRIYYTDY